MDPGPTKKSLGQGPRKIKNADPGPGLGMPAAPYPLYIKNLYLFNYLKSNLIVWKIKIQYYQILILTNVVF